MQEERSSKWNEREMREINGIKKKKKGAKVKSKNTEDEEERVEEGEIQISLLVSGCWDKKRNDDIAVKI